ncbi:MAG: OsmC family protein [Candidatus Thermoplasmatota archaeon]|nr:OsmC family protein [Candidatus Thermoplasmatota archaeon]
MRINNIELDQVEESRKKATINHNSLPSIRTIEGRFSLDKSPMFSAGIGTEKSSFVLGCDEPGILGGQGILPTPLTYLLFGVMSCYASTLAMQCALDGITLSDLGLTGKLHYDLGPVVTGENMPIIRKLELQVHSSMNLGPEIEKARKRCPAVFAIENPIETEIRQS